MRAPLLALLLTAALLSGCVVEETDPETETTAEGQAQAQDPAASEPASQPAAEETPAGPHGTPQRTDSPITTGTDPQSYPGAWARQTVTITNDFGGATLGDLQASVSAGSITVRAEDRVGYSFEAALESRAATEADARDMLERTHVDHSDVLDGSTLFLQDGVRIDDPAPATPLPLPPGFIQLGTDASLRVDFVIVVPLLPAVALAASASSGDISASDLHGPRLDLTTSSGSVRVDVVTVTDVTLSSSSGDLFADNVVADTFSAATSSGDIHGDALTIGDVSVSTSSGDAYVAGTMDDIDAESSSGDLRFEAAAATSGTYALDSSSGTVVMSLTGAGAAYSVEASTSSGDIDVDVPDGEVIEEEEDHVEVASPGYDDAKLRTAIDVSTSSGDITVDAE